MREHRITHRVHYGETDQMGVVYHARFFFIFETARTELLRAAGMAYRDLEARGLFLVVTDTGCRFHANAGYDEVIAVHTRVTRVGKATVRFEYAVRTEDGARLLVEGHTELAAVDRSWKPVRLPADVVALLS